ncbi:MAG: hypothetical protein KatS3mg115_1636 [Candidatus Poribacteria bacterium]|nr:MAG: hypothetical protein KatS3mg115_1636 [Candidatus Poribacteria bacterium]
MWTPMSMHGPPPLCFLHEEPSAASALPPRRSIQAARVVDLAQDAGAPVSALSSLRELPLKAEVLGGHQQLPGAGRALAIIPAHVRGRWAPAASRRSRASPRRGRRSPTARGTMFGDADVDDGDLRVAEERRPGRCSGLRDAVPSRPQASVRTCGVDVAARDRAPRARRPASPGCASARSRPTPMTPTFSLVFWRVVVRRARPIVFAPSCVLSVGTK